MEPSGLNLLYFSRGYTTHDRRFLQSFVAAGQTVSFLRLTNECLEPRDVPAAVRVIPWPGSAVAGNTAGAWSVRQRELRSILAELGPDVILAGPVQGPALLVALTGYTPLISMAWGSDMLVEARSSQRMARHTRYALARSVGAFGDCQAVRAALREFSALTDESIVTFPWGIDHQRFCPGHSSLALREERGWQQDPVIISTRSWEPIYAIDALLRAFARVRRRFPTVKLLLLGDGSQASVILRMIRDFELTGAVFLPGRVNNDLLPDYFRLADLYVSSALSDGTSISLLEAFGCGLPAVVTRGSGNLEWVEGGVNGWLAEPGNERSLAEALEAALANRNQWPEIGGRNVETVRARADWNRNFPELLSLLERLARPRTPSEQRPAGKSLSL